MDYITAQVPPQQQNLPRPRFSLYLSSQLQYGVVVVYHRQCGFLLDEIQHAIDRLLRSKRTAPLDIPESDRLVLDLPDNLCMMEQAEGALDPFFGHMASHQLPSPYKQPGWRMDDLSSDACLMGSSHATSEAEGFRSPPASITLREREQFVMPSAERFEGADLPEATNRELDLLMEEQDQFREDVEEQLRDGKNQSRDLMSSITQLKESVLGPQRDSLLLPVEEMAQTAELQKDGLPQEMTPERVTMPTSPTEQPEEVIVRPVRKPDRRRKRQLVFADREVQISNEEMQKQIGNPAVETRNLNEVLVNLGFVTKYFSPAQLFSSPCRGFVHADLKSLWKQSAVLTPLSKPAEDVRGQEEEPEEILMTERKRRRSTMKETSSDSGLQPLDGSSALGAVLELSKEDRSASAAVTPVSRRSSPGEVQPVMETIAEENIEMPEAQPDSQSSELSSWICSQLQKSGQVTFTSLLPPQADRGTAAHTLYRVLALLSAGRVRAEQAAPYTDIFLCAS